MIRSVLSAFAVVVLCFAILQIPGKPETVQLPSATATPPLNLLPVPDSDELWTAVHLLEDRVADLEKRPLCPPVSIVEPAKAPAPIVTRSAVVQSSYTPRWSSNDGRSLRQHAIEIHGFDPNLSDAQIAMQHDAWHDQNGPIAPRTSAAYSQQWQPATRSRSVQFSSGTSNCPGGVCPTSRSVQVQSSGGVLGFGILGRRR